MEEEAIKLPEPTAWNCQLVMNDSDGIVEGWFTTKPEDDPDDIPKGWNARIERFPVFTADQVRAAVLAERARCARLADALKVDSPNNWNQIGQTETAKQIAAAIRSGNSITETARPEE